MIELKNLWLDGILHGFLSFNEIRLSCLLVFYAFDNQICGEINLLASFVNYLCACIRLKREVWLYGGQAVLLCCTGE